MTRNGLSLCVHKFKKIPCGRYYEDDIVKESPMDVYTEDNFRTELRMSKAEIIKICDIV